MLSLAEYFPGFMTNILFESYLNNFCHSNPIIRKNFFELLCFIMKSIFSKNRLDELGKITETYTRLYATIEDEKIANDMLVLVFIGSWDPQHIVSMQPLQILQSSVLKIANLLKIITKNFVPFLFSMLTVFFGYCP